MNDENIYGSGETANNAAPVLDDIAYEAPTAKNNGPQGVSAPVLDDMDYYVPPSAKKDGPQGVSAPVLDDFDDYVPNNEKKGAPQNISAPVLDDDNYNSSNAAAEEDDSVIIAGFSAEQRAMYDNLPPEKQRQVIDMRKAQLAQQKASEPVKPAILDDADSYVPPVKNKQQTETVTAPVLDDEDSYVPPVKEEKKPEAPVSAPILDDEPEPAKYVPKFVDEDLEKAKQEAKKKAVSSQLTSNQKDEKESLRMMLELKAEREAEAAKKGFKITLLLALVGIIGAVLFLLVYSGKFFGLSYMDGENKLCTFVENNAMYISIFGGLCSLLLITGMGAMKSLSSFFYLVFSIVQLVGIFMMMPQLSGNAGIKWGLCIGALVCSIAVFVTLSASESVGLFFKKPTPDRDMR